MEVIERTLLKWTDRESAALLISSKHREIPPMELLTYEGFDPIGDPLLESGQIYFDLFLNDRDALAYAVVVLEEFGDVTVDYLSETFRYQVLPTTPDFKTLMDQFTHQQLEVLSLAVEKGYFEDVREITIKEIAKETGTTPSTVSRHLRNARLRAMQFIVEYTTRL